MTLSIETISKKGTPETGVERENVGDRATIYRDTNVSPNWYVQYSVEGKQFRSSLKTRIKKRAAELARKKDAELVLGVAQTPAKRAATFGAAIENYLLSLQGQERIEQTLVLYRRDLRQFESYCLQNNITKLKDVTADVLERYQRLLKTTGFTVPAPVEGGRRRRRSAGCKANKPRTVRSKMKTIRQLIRFAVKRRMITEDPAPGYFLPPEVKTAAYCWTTEELTKILDQVDGTIKEIFDFLRFTGLRSAELCWLMKEDVELGANPHIKIRRKTCPQSGKTWRPKHGNERAVPLCPAALAIAKKAAADSPGPWLFHAADTTGDTPGRWRSNRIWKLLKAAMKAAGVKGGTIHTFRHVFCSFLMKQGNVSPFQVMKLMGQNSLDIVLQYCHASQDELAAAVGGVDFSQMLIQPAGKEAA